MKRLLRLGPEHKTEECPNHLFVCFLTLACCTGSNTKQAVVCEPSLQLRGETCGSGIMLILRYWSLYRGAPFLLGLRPQMLHPGSHALITIQVTDYVQEEKSKQQNKQQARTPWGAPHPEEKASWTQGDLTLSRLCCMFFSSISDPMRLNNFQSIMGPLDYFTWLYTKWIPG